MDYEKELERLREIVMDCVKNNRRECEVEIAERENKQVEKSERYQGGTGL